MKKVNIGLDIGIASVGWSIYDIENKKIINAGSRIFSEANTGSTASDRRAQRGRRRLLRRKILRKNDAKKLFVEFNFIKSVEDFYNLNFDIDYLKTRKIALEQKITIEELVVLLYKYVKNRGSFNYKDDLVELSEANNEDIDLKDLNQTAKTPVEIQTKIQEEFGKYRGVNTKESLIAHVWYVEEIIKILDKQIGFGLISEDFKGQYLKIFNRKRDYFQGPGWVDHLKTKKSKYGWKDVNEWYDNLVGKDTYDRKQTRAPKDSLTAYLFNILNDLNNLKITGRPDGLTQVEKETLIQETLENNGPKANNITLKRIIKLINQSDEIAISEKDISGFRIDKSEKPLFTKFESINKMKSILFKNSLDASFFNLKNIAEIDKICEKLTIYQSIDSRVEELKKLQYSFLTDKHCEVLGVISLSGTHSLSYKTMNLFISEAWAENKNQMQIFSEKNMKPDYQIQNNIEFKNFKSIPVFRQKISEMYISPVVKRSLIETLKIIKEIEKLPDIEINDIVVELARESNSDDYKKHINEVQKRNESINNNIKDSYNTETKKISPKLREKLILLNEQDGKCAYSGETIDKDRLLSDPNYCEVDHILPFSLSFDDSRTNRVLVLRHENQDKGQCTPWEYFRNIGRDWKQFEARNIKNYIENKSLGKMGKIKFNNLMFTGDLTSDEVKNEFINRNLSDTRYATVEVKNYLTYFVKELNKKYKIKTINGRFTSYVRGAFLHLPKKDRNDYSHHAIDATVCAIAPIIDIGTKKTINNILSKNENLNETQIIYQSQIDTIKNDIINFAYKFSRKVEKRTNVQLFDETIYTTKRQDDGKLHKILKMDLLATDNKTIKKNNEIIMNNPKAFLIYESDKKTWDYLEKIFKTYYGEKNDEDKVISNPFHHFVFTEKNKLQKQSNEENKPNIRYLRYVDNKSIDTFEDIGYKFKQMRKDNDKKIVISGLNAIAWDLFYSQTLDKYIILPLTMRVAKFANKKSDEVIINEEKYKVEKTIYKIDDSYEFQYRLFKFSELEFEYDGIKENLVVVGFRRSEGMLEFKKLNFYTDSKSRIFKTVSKMKKIKVINTNSTRTKIQKTSCF